MRKITERALMLDPTEYGGTLLPMQDERLEKTSVDLLDSKRRRKRVGMALEMIHLPDGQTYSVMPVADGYLFRSSRVELKKGGDDGIPVEWTVGLRTEEEGHRKVNGVDDGSPTAYNSSAPASTTHILSSAQPTRRSDVLSLLTYSSPNPSSESEPGPSLGQVAMMLWVSLHWYYHQPEPPSDNNDDDDDDWTVAVRVLLSGSDEGAVVLGLAQTGLLATKMTSVGRMGDGGGLRMFITQRMFWQLPHDVFLLSSREAIKTLTAAAASLEKKTADDVAICTKTTVNNGDGAYGHGKENIVVGAVHQSMPAYCYHYPPLPLQYTTTTGVRHPLRPPPPPMGSVFYTRFLPSVGRYLSFRAASTSSTPVAYHGPVSQSPHHHPHQPQADDKAILTTLSDTQLLERWFAKPRVSAFWGAWEPSFLEEVAGRRHSFPVMGLWDGVPFGYFEIYWVREDILGRVLLDEESGGGDDAVGDFDRGLHVLVGEEWARGRASEWLTSLVHWCLVVEGRTMRVCMEPRVDNERITKHLDVSGFKRVKQITFPHKQSWFVRLRRETWTGPLL